jgi:hypothetical protein
MFALEEEVPMIDRCFDSKRAYELDPENWWDAIDGEILDRLREHGSTSVRELGRSWLSRRGRRRRSSACSPAKEG